MSLLRVWMSHVSVPRASSPSLRPHFADHLVSDKSLVLPRCTRSKPHCLALRLPPNLTASAKPRACTNAALTAFICHHISRHHSLTYRILRLQPLKTWLVRAGPRKRSSGALHMVTEYSRTLTTELQGCLLMSTQNNPTWFLCGLCIQQVTPSFCSPITPSAHSSYWTDTVFRIRYIRLLYYSALQDVYHTKTVLACGTPRSPGPHQYPTNTHPLNLAGYEYITYARPQSSRLSLLRNNTRFTYRYTPTLFRSNFDTISMKRETNSNTSRTFTPKFVLPPSYQPTNIDAQIKNAIREQKKAKADTPQLQLPSVRTFLGWENDLPVGEYKTLVLTNIKAADDATFLGITHYLIHELGFPIQPPTPQDIATFRAAKDARTCSDLPAPTASRVVRAFDLGRPGYEVRQGMGANVTADSCMYSSPLCFDLHVETGTSVDDKGLLRTERRHVQISLFRTPRELFVGRTKDEPSLIPVAAIYGLHADSAHTRPAHAFRLRNTLDMLLRTGGFPTPPLYEVFWTLTHYRGKTRATDKTYRFYQILLLHDPIHDQDLRAKFYKALFNNEIGGHVEINLGSLCCRMVSTETPTQKQSNWTPSQELFRIAVCSETLLSPIQVWQACEAIGIPSTDIEDIIWTARNPLTSGRKEKERLVEQTYIYLDDRNTKIKLCWEISRTGIVPLLRKALGDETLRLLYHTIAVPPGLPTQRFLYGLHKATDTATNAPPIIPPPTSLQPFGPTVAPQMQTDTPRSYTPKRQRQMDTSPSTEPAPAPTCPELCEIALHIASDLVPLSKIHAILAQMENAVAALYEIDAGATLTVLDYYKNKVDHSIPERSSEEHSRVDSDIFGSDSN